MEAWRQLSPQNAELVLVGQVDEVGRKILAAHDGNFRHIEQVPKHEVHRLFRTADVFLFPSLSEGSAYVVYEAMACGLPVITTQASGSVVRDELDGFIVPERSSEAIAQKLDILLRNADLRKEMGLSGRELILKNYTWSHYGSRVVAEYRRLLET
jgi:glycosyltransferase involved in cell wall biosynthesis